MESWIEFGRGPLFRLAFVLMILGLLRVVCKAFYSGMAHEINGFRDRRNGVDDFATSFPERKINGSLPLVLTETMFHLLVIFVPLFTVAHVVAWKKSVGFAWWNLPQNVEDNLTLLIIFAAPVLSAIRLSLRSSRRRFGSFWKPLFVMVPFVTGYICVNGQLSPTAYYTSMLIHIWVGNALMLAFGFTDMTNWLIEPIVVFSRKIGGVFGRAADPIFAAFSSKGDEE
jgi:hypothetical protein